VFIVSNTHLEQMELGLIETIGEKWKDLFDMIVIDARKPLFQQIDSSFFEYNEKNESMVGTKGLKVTDSE
jgi:hypothetical protein